MQQSLDFQTHYQTVLEPELQELDILRRRTGVRILAAFGGLALLLALTFVLLAESLDHPLILIMPLMLAFVLGLVLYGLLVKGYRRAFKQRIVTQIVRFVDDQLTYQPEDKISLTAFHSSQLFQQRVDRYRGEDLVTGRVGATNLSFSEVHAEYKTTTTDSKGRTRTNWHTIFKGIFFIADFNKHFQGATIVRPDSAERVFGRLGQTLQSWGASLSGMQLVKLEDPEFEQAFAVYASDQIEARYILSTSLMQRILAFRRKFNRPVHLSFVNSYIHVAISSSKNLFEPPLWRSCVDIDLVQEYLQDLLLVLGIVEELNLNLRIWSKQP